jgi:hypothetical protein
MKLTTVLQYFSLQFIFVLWLHLRFGSDGKGIPIMLPTINHQIMWLDALLDELQCSQEGILQKWLIRKIQKEIDHWEQLQSAGLLYAVTHRNE